MSTSTSVLRRRRHTSAAVGALAAAIVAGLLVAAPGRADTGPPSLVDPGMAIHPFTDFSGEGSLTFFGTGLDDERGNATVLALQRPDLGDDPRARVADALGMAVELVELSDTDGDDEPRGWQIDALHEQAGGYHCEESSLECDSSLEGRPGPQEAEAAARAVLEALGQDPDDYAVVAEPDSPYEGWVSPIRSVTAELLVGEHPTGVTLRLDISVLGVYSAYGTLADPVEIADVEVVSEREALERLGDPRFRAVRNGYPVESPDDWYEATVDENGEIVYLNPSGETAPPEPEQAEPQGVVPFRVEQVRIVDAVLGHGLLEQDWSPPRLVPVYELVAEDGSTWSVIAVSDSDLGLG